ncbi:SAM-dependent methyltransferase [Streptomyces albireticuli]|uniref:SAM-dependent methyltransferase n=1 Tax=Streptomyces albireticuli TaxID=1940 RepID=A0A2A2D5S0_9ACTN|nr:class I SAM-dependent methyltransferase [Streptomyces albireticuli]MCD9195029.1 methyltransferase domain-containing protein [Streptomyces albireticuli]PAU46797.1 SAM-dependent methyltransferase [Streptomyces albireticuli]
MSQDTSTPGAGEDATRRYYDSTDVDAFYRSIWGGEDIHTGIYLRPDEPVAAASRRTVARVADRLADRLGPGRSVLDLGSGYGGTARYLAERFGCRVVALNLSAAQNAHHRATNAERGLAGLVEVVTGSFHDIPFTDGHFDAVCSLEALCHSDDRARALGEAARVLAPGGALAFTDIMAAEDTPAEALRPAVSRLGVDTLATPSSYHRRLTELALTDVGFDDHSEQLLTHYTRLTAETHAREGELRRTVSGAYVDHLLENLPVWAEAARGGKLRWGVMHGRRAG